MRKKAVFLDRDGTIIEEKNYLSNPDDVVLIEGASEAIKKLSQNNFYIIMVTNQSGVARGYFSEQDAVIVNNRVKQLLEQDGACIDAIYYCPHHPKGVIEEYNINCECRKPNIGMAIKAQNEHDIDLSKSYMIGDKKIDIEFALNANMKNGYLLATGHGKEEELPNNYGCKAKNILDAAKQILND